MIGRQFSVLSVPAETDRVRTIRVLFGGKIVEAVGVEVVLFEIAILVVQAD
jgi:hypothetical protein